MNFKNPIKHFFALTFVLGISFLVQAQELNFNDSWLFYNEIAEGAENPEFDDSDWKKLDLPHDLAI